MPGNGILFILVGPSGSGKNTLMDHVMERVPELEQQPTMTTRPSRTDEQEEREHYFVSEERFSEAIRNRELLEHEKVHLKYYYGTPRQPVADAIAADQDRIADIECHGAIKVHRAFPDNTILVFITPPSLDILADRIRARRDKITPEEVAHRLARARFEMAFAPQADYLLINDDLEVAIEELRQIVLTEQHEKGRRQVNNPGWRPTAEHQIDAVAVPLIRHSGRLLTRDQGAFGLPNLPVPPGRMPHEHVIASIQEIFGRTPHIHSDRDERFDFPAPNYVAIQGTSPHITLYYYYECELDPLPDRLPDGWSWHPAHELHWPENIATQLATPS